MLASCIPSRNSVDLVCGRRPSEKKPQAVTENWNLHAKGAALIFQDLTNKCSFSTGSLPGRYARQVLHTCIQRIRSSNDRLRKMVCRTSPGSRWLAGVVMVLSTSSGCSGWSTLSFFRFFTEGIVRGGFAILRGNGVYQLKISNKPSNTNKRTEARCRFQMLHDKSSQFLTFPQRRKLSWAIAKDQNLVLISCHCAFGYVRTVLRLDNPK
jgi:hypothetical protein